MTNTFRCHDAEACAMGQKKCPMPTACGIHQIQEPAVNQQLTVEPVAAMTNALREAEAALEVAMARILKVDPGHSISVTSEAKALVAVRAALAATPAAGKPVYGCDECYINHDFGECTAPAPVVLPEPVGAMSATRPRTVAWNCMFTPEAGTKLYTEKQVRALLATGGQAQAVEQTPILYVSKGQLDNHSDPDGPDSANAGRYLPCRITPAGKFTTPLFAAPQGQAGARDAGTFEQRMSDWSQEDAIDAERYRFIVEHKLILSGGAKKFGWAIAPFGVECHRYIDAARAAIAAVKGE